MADFDKESLMNMLGGLVGEDKKGAVESLINSIDGNKSGNAPPLSSTDFGAEINTAELMAKMTGVMDKLKHSRNNREVVLLSAIRPYLRDERKSKADACLKLLQVVSVMNEIKKEV